MTNLQKKLVLTLLVIPLVLIAALQIHNIKAYPIERGFDYIDHLAYINIIKSEQRLPLANEGGETDHPPLYYIIASVFPQPEQIKILGFFCWILLSGLTYFLLKKVFQNKINALMGGLITTSLPVILYMTPQLGNELFASTLITVSLIYHLLERQFTKKYFVIQGILLGLGIFTKVTAIVLILAITIDLIVRHRRQLLKLIPQVVVMFVFILLIGGFYYLRNWIVFQNPFITTLDFPEMRFTQLPGYRDIKFFTDLSAFFKGDLFTAHFYSLWAGTYFSWFYDGHNVLIPVQEFSKAGIALVIMSLPLLILFLRGYWLAFCQKKFLLFLIYPPLLFLFYVYFAIKLPFYSSVKAVYLLSTVVPFVFFIAYNFQKVRFLKLLLFIIYLNIYTVVIIKNFWILPYWY